MGVLRGGGVCPLGPGSHGGQRLPSGGPAAWPQVCTSRASPGSVTWGPDCHPIRLMETMVKTDHTSQKTHRSDFTQRAPALRGKEHDSRSSVASKQLCAEGCGSGLRPKETHGAPAPVG